MPDFVKARGSGCVITVCASPDASRTEATGVDQWRGALRVKIAAQPRDGAANMELIRFLAEKLDVPRKSIEILRGNKTSVKLVFVPVSVETAKRLLVGG